MSSLSFLQPQIVAIQFLDISYKVKQQDDIMSVLFCTGAHVKADKSISSCRCITNLYNIILQLGQLTRFNMLFELQQFASSLAYSQVVDPLVLLTPPISESPSESRHCIFRAFVTICKAHPDSEGHVHLPKQG